MTYSDFTLARVQQEFGLQVVSDRDLFAATPPLEPSPLLTEFLQEYAPLALQINTEKARSEMIIAPVLLELQRRFRDRLSLFSGIEFNIDAARGLKGICDFLLSRSPQQLFYQAPIAVLVEAKKENITAGLGQCAAEMVAAQVFNEQHHQPIPIILGTVTSGNIWRFLTLKATELAIDRREYYLPDINKILGILASGV